MLTGPHDAPDTAAVTGNAAPGGAQDADVPASAAASPQVGAELDITADTCPMTFVRTRIALDRLPAGALLRVRLRGEEPRRSVPRTAQQQGHELVSLEEGPDGTATLLLRKGQRGR